MSTCDEPQGADPRALLSAAAFGSLAGLVLGGGYLVCARLATPAFAPAITPAQHASAVTPLRRAFTRPVVQADAADPPGPRMPLRLLPFTAEPFRPAVVAVSDRDRACLTQAVYYEARGEAAEGQQAVAQVVLNRLRHPAYPKSVCGVVFQHSLDGCQFSFACEDHPAVGRESAAWRRANGVAQQALDGFVMRRVGRATNFHVSNLATRWSQGLAQIAQIGAHVFYGFAPHGAATSSGRRAEPAPRLADAPTPPVAASLSMASLGDATADRIHVTETPTKFEIADTNRPVAAASTLATTTTLSAVTTAATVTAPAPKSSSPSATPVAAPTPSPIKPTA